MAAPLEIDLTETIDLPNIYSKICLNHNKFDIVLFKKHNVTVLYPLNELKKSIVIADINNINQKLSSRFLDVFRFVINSNMPITISYSYLLTLFKLFKNISLESLTLNMPLPFEVNEFYKIIELIKPKQTFLYKAISIKKTKRNVCVFYLIRDTDNCFNEIRIRASDEQIIAYFKNYATLDHLLSLVQVKLISNI